MNLVKERKRKREREREEEKRKTMRKSQWTLFNETKSLLVVDSPSQRSQVLDL